MLAGAVWSGCATGLTGDPSEATDKTLVITGQLISNVGGEVEWWLEYGTTTDYGSSTPHFTNATEQNVPKPVFTEVTGLERDTLYHYRLCAQDSEQQGGPGCGEDRRARTQSFACGDTVTQDVRLTASLQCFEVVEPALYVGASGIDVNLAGHAIRGIVDTGGGVAPGIDNNGAFDDVTIRNGFVGGFGNALELDGASRNRVLGVEATGARNGIAVKGGEANEIRRSAASGRAAGIVIDHSNGVVIADTTARGGFGPGIELTASDARIVRGQASGGAPGICCRTDGIVVTGNRNRVAEMEAVGANGAALRLVSGGDNVFVDNELLDAILVEDDVGDHRGDGLFVGPFTAGTVIRGNHAHDNEGDGIEVRSASARLGANRAEGNGDFGIDAAAGVTDLGGNTASGNGNPLQCRNVFCQ